MAEQLPYVPSYGLIGKVLTKVRTAATPDRFTHDFLATKLGMTGGSARSLPSYLKRVGFLGKDGAPTELYKRFRNPSQTGTAAAEALRTGYRVLYEMNENAHQLSEKDLKGLLVQATGLEPESGTVKAILGSFKALKQVATFDGGTPGPQQEKEEPAADEEVRQPSGPKLDANIGLSYTINLNLPATTPAAERPRLVSLDGIAAAA